jgi:hypothetical protein
MIDLTVLEQLKGLGAEEKKHVNGSLLSHLQGTHDLLRAWGNRTAICHAGLYHAVYGTADFQDKLISVQSRDSIAALIGKEAEQLVYLFSACDRDYVYSGLTTKNILHYRDRFQQKDYDLSAEAAADLCELTMANELEIARWRAPESLCQDYLYLRPVLAHMKPFVSPNGVREFERIFGETA